MTNYKNSVFNIVMNFVIAVLAVVGVALYIYNGQTVGQFQGTSSQLTTYVGIATAVAAVALALLSMLNLKGAAGYVVRVITGLLKLVVVVLLIYCLMDFVATRVEGLAFIFGSDESVTAEVQSAVNMASAYVAIAGMGAYAVAWLLSVVAAFFSGRKVVKE